MPDPNDAMANALADVAELFGRGGGWLSLRPTSTIKLRQGFPQEKAAGGYWETHLPPALLEPRGLTHGTRGG